ncbi:FAD dependent oxidoreductase [Natrialba chahannaoensis JCM 10990]|uniref:FAD dependent oxidoreductase n=1 Tax=Natrialba chahannaoensis JCM 10990 TaxID=1227492 RepID=M0AVB4_9EURY|nr:FAD-dependent oxidoreductase [Natrialba chahannaoensis]ELZ01898.1 FAD dependent oxidoreductase [Natrialba chahannaoensis JCM 10990]
MTAPDSSFSCAPSLPGEPTAVWLAEPADAALDEPTGGATDEPVTESVDKSAPALTTDRTVDVCVVGAGIAGLSTALEVRERGKRVAVLERDRIAAGITGKSTAKLTSQHGAIYDHLRREFGRREAKQYAAVQEQAIDEVEGRIEEFGIDCGFERQPSYLYGDDRDTIERETDAAEQAGLPATFVTSVPPFERAQAAVRFDEQAWFHPRQYLLGIADVLQDDDGAAVYEGTRVTDVESGAPCRVQTESATVTAEQVVLATGFPILDRAGYFARMHPKRSYVLALRLDGEPPAGMYYRTGDNYRSVRTYRGGGSGADGSNGGDKDSEDLLLVGGENHKTGQGGSTVERYRTLLEWARERFPVESVAYRWSNQDYKPVDKVPFVGRVGAGAQNVYVATGFRGWGMTNGVAAGQLLAALIDGRKPPERKLFDPMRVTPKASAGKTITENVDAASEFATDWFRAMLTPELRSLAPGEGTVIRSGGKPVACARDAGGDLHATSAVCTHMYCLVEWNDAECSWDCPCHGSRFAPNGEVLQGPANEGLSSASIDGGVEVGDSAGTETSVNIDSDSDSDNGRVGDGSESEDRGETEGRD